MIEHKYDIGDTVKWYLKKLNDEGQYENVTEGGPASGVIKQVIDEELINEYFSAYPDEPREALYGIDVNWNSPCLKTNSYKDMSIEDDDSTIISLCLMKESEIFM